MAAKKKSVAMHTNYLSACSFTNSDMQVRERRCGGSAHGELSKGQKTKEGWQGEEAFQCPSIIIIIITITSFKYS